jgi:crotonobetainyl-CoA:carnitine CoA-transferase CaiB-like acyl-CoA transferase
MSAHGTRAPLAGVKVLDFTHGVAGPYTSMLMGDLGCDVIKIEQPGRGDSTRYMNVASRFVTDIPAAGGDYFLAISRNKRSVCIDIKTTEGRALCHRLAEWSDIALQSFRPGVMKRLGLDYAALRKVNPKLIYGSLSAYGLDGVLADKPGMDVAVQARSGVMRLTGAPAPPNPCVRGVPGRFRRGIYLYAAQPRVYHRERTGEGQKLALAHGCHDEHVDQLPVAVRWARRLAPAGSGHPTRPYQAFPTADGYVVIAAGTNKTSASCARHLAAASHRGPALSQQPGSRAQPRGHRRAPGTADPAQDDSGVARDFRCGRHTVGAGERHDPGVRAAERDLAGHGPDCRASDGWSAASPRNSVSFIARRHSPAAAAAARSAERHARPHDPEIDACAPTG